MPIKYLIILTLSFIGIISACSTYSALHQEAVADSIPKPAESYESVLKRWTNEEKDYRNFSSNFQVTATFVAPELIEQQLYLDAIDFHWTQDKFRDEKQRVLYQAESSASVFIDLYTDKDEYNNLD